MKCQKAVYNQRMSDLFSKEFLQQLTLELTSKGKPSRSILEALRQSTQINANCRAEIAKLTQQLEHLEQENARLTRENYSYAEVVRRVTGNAKPIFEDENAHPQSTEPIETLCSLQVAQEMNGFCTPTAKLVTKQDDTERTDSLNEIGCLGTKKSVAMSLHSFPIVHMPSSMSSNSKLDEMSIDLQFLRQKVESLEEYKAVREQRYGELVNKEARYAGEIELLSNKNITLMKEVSKLQRELMSITSVKCIAEKIEQKPISSMTEHLINEYNEDHLNTSKKSLFDYINFEETHDNQSGIAEVDQECEEEKSSEEKKNSQKNSSEEKSQEGSEGEGKQSVSFELIPSSSAAIAQKPSIPEDRAITEEPVAVRKESYDMVPIKLANGYP